MPLSREMTKLRNRNPGFCPMDNGRNNGSVRMRGCMLSPRAYKRAMKEKENEGKPIFKIKEE